MSQKQDQTTVVLPLRYNRAELSVYPGKMPSEDKQLEKGHYCNFSKNDSIYHSIRTCEEAIYRLELPENQIALILVDVWGSGTEKDLECMSKEDHNIHSLLTQFRKKCMCVIHAPNMPAINDFKQYQDLRKKVQAMMVDHERYPEPEFMSWPPRENPLSNKMRNLRTQSWPTATTTKINFYAKPRDDEYMAYTHEELRYILWKEKIYFILYVGYGINHCILRRQTGINSLVGTDNCHEEDYTKMSRTPISIAVVEDCVLCSGSSFTTPKELKKTMIDYLKSALAFSINSQEIEFKQDKTYG